MFAKDQELKFVVGTRDKFPWCLKVLYNLFRFRKHFAQKNPPRISRILRTQKFVWHPYKDVRFGIFRRLIQLVCGTHTAHPRFAKNARRMEVRNESQSFLSAYFKKYSHRAEVRRSERRAKTKRAEHYRQCLPIIANTEKRFFICISSRLGLALGSVRLGSPRLVSSHRVSSRLV